jgi:hypothetical protein
MSYQDPKPTLAHPRMDHTPLEPHSVTDLSRQRRDLVPADDFSLTVDATFRLTVAVDWGRALTLGSVILMKYGQGGITV